LLPGALAIVIVLSAGLATALLSAVLSSSPPSRPSSVATAAADSELSGPEAPTPPGGSIRESPGGGLSHPLTPVDPWLQSGLEDILRRQGLEGLAASGRLSVALVDLGKPYDVPSAMVNGDRMLYAASLPKLAILLGAYEAIVAGRLPVTDRLRRQLTRMIRVSDNASATAVLDRVGFPAVARTLRRPSYGLYTPALGGGLWVGKAYAEDRYWRRDPIASLSHGATARQAARFFVLLDRGLLVSPDASREMKRLLGHPAIDHKFVRGLGRRPGATIYRKSGTWRDFHADAALVVRPDARYVAAGLVHSRRGERVLQDLIVELDDLVRRRVRPRPLEDGP